MDGSNQWYVLLNVTLAAVLSGVIGYEREVLNKPAGFRTHMIVGGASCLLFSLGIIIIDIYKGAGYGNLLQIDLIRVIEAIVVGISFIGAGTIIKSRQDESVHNLTTAATILFSAGIGISIALEQYIIAIGATFLVLLINTIIRKIDKTFIDKEKK